MRLMNAVVAVGLVASGSAHAQSANMVGYGLSSCRDIVATTIQDQPRTLEIMGWVFGYMSGLNTGMIISQKQYRDIGAVVKDGAAGALTVPLLRACKDNPTRNFADVVGEFYSTLPIRNFH
ncbi:hypothetical protein ACQKKX_04500 [Neorhizobium sp. NPDC001467]|uniref:hypothetical protein n=1 Tax=Neorhizobium sp. NPDC001467 TaxID=3390595 RepID=UPI003CFFF452